MPTAHNAGQASISSAINVSKSIRTVRSSTIRIWDVMLACTTRCRKGRTVCDLFPYSIWNLFLFILWIGIKGTKDKDKGWLWSCVKGCSVVCACSRIDVEGDGLVKGVRSVGETIVSRLLLLGGKGICVTHSGIVRGRLTCCVAYPSIVRSWLAWCRIGVTHPSVVRWLLTIGIAHSSIVGSRLPYCVAAHPWIITWHRLWWDHSGTAARPWLLISYGLSKAAHSRIVAIHGISSIQVG